MTFEQAAYMLYQAADDGVKYKPAHLLERLAQIAITVKGAGARETERAWFGAPFEDRWAFCCRVGQPAHETAQKRVC